MPDFNDLLLVLGAPCVLFSRCLDPTEHNFFNYYDSGYGIGYPK